MYMQQLDLFGSPSNILPQKKKNKTPTASVQKVEEKKPSVSQVFSNPMGTEVIVNDQIKIKVKQVKGNIGEAKEVNSAAIIEKIKARLKKEFDLDSPVPRDDDAFIKYSNRKKNTSTEELSKAGKPKIPNDEELYNKQYYTMGQVSAMFQINQSMLRYWENEFDILKPKKNRKGDRYFRPEDVKNIELIFDLLKRRKFTIEGAKKYLKENTKKADAFAAVQSLEKIKAFLIQLKGRLE